MSNVKRKYLFWSPLSSKHIFLENNLCVCDCGEDISRKKYRKNAYIFVFDTRIFGFDLQKDKESSELVD